MQNAHLPSSAADSLSVADLLSRYLQRQIVANVEGVGLADPLGEVEPHEAGPVQPVDPALAWKDGSTVATLLAPDTKTAWKAPPEWSAFVSQQDSQVAVPFSLGSYPQLVRNFAALLSDTPTAFRRTPAEPLRLAGLLEWAQSVRTDADRLLAAGLLRQAGHLGLAEKTLAFTPPAALADLHTNESAALAWQQGKTSEAIRLWRELSQRNPTCVPARFNLGMALLFSGEGAAEPELAAAVDGLPETGAWHHLASLYRTMAAMR